MVPQEYQQLKYKEDYHESVQIAELERRAFESNIHQKVLLRIQLVL